MCIVCTVVNHTRSLLACVLRVEILKFWNSCLVIWNQEFTLYQINSINVSYTYSHTHSLSHSCVCVRRKKERERERNSNATHCTHLEFVEFSILVQVTHCVYHCRSRACACTTNLYTHGHCRGELAALNHQLPSTRSFEFGACLRSRPTWEHFAAALPRGELFNTDAAAARAIHSRATLGLEELNQ